MAAGEGRGLRRRGNGLRAAARLANMGFGQDRQDHHVAEIQAGRDAGDEAGRPKDGTGAEPRQRRAQGPRKPREPKAEGPKAAPTGRAAELRATRSANHGGDGAPKPGRKAVARKLPMAPAGFRVPGAAELAGIVGLRRLGLCAALGALWVLGGCGGGLSGEIGQACIGSGREAASRQLCSCVQGVANQTLSPTDQRRVARFFSNPEEAEATRASDSARDEAFWDRYRSFTDTAEAICG